MCDTEDIQETNALEHVYNYNYSTITDSTIVNNIVNPSTFIDSYYNSNQDETIGPKSYTNLEVGLL